MAPAGLAWSCVSPGGSPRPRVKAPRVGWVRAAAVADPQHSWAGLWALCTGTGGRTKRTRFHVCILVYLCAGLPGPGSWSTAHRSRKPPGTMGRGCGSHLSGLKRPLERIKVRIYTTRLFAVTSKDAVAHRRLPKYL